MGSKDARTEITTICGSMQFFDGMLSLASDPFVAKNEKNNESDPFLATELGQLHREKIRRSDRVMVVTDENGYIGESTKSEIEYATVVGIPYQIVSMIGTHHDVS